jgi:hypothetical protein
LLRITSSECTWVDLAHTSCCWLRIAMISSSASAPQARDSYTWRQLDKRWNFPC